MVPGVVAKPRYGLRRAPECFCHGSRLYGCVLNPFQPALPLVGICRQVQFILESGQTQYPLDGILA